MKKIYSFLILILISLVVTQQTALGQIKEDTCSELIIKNDKDTLVGPEIDWQGYRQHWRQGIDVANHGGSADMVLLAADIPGVGVRDYIYVNANKTGTNTLTDTSIDPTIGFFLTPTVNNVQSIFSATDRNPDRTILGVRSSQYSTSNGKYLAFYNSAGTTTPVFWIDNSLVFNPLLKVKGNITMLSTDVSNTPSLELNANPTDISTDFLVKNYYNPATGYNFLVTDKTNFNYLVMNNLTHNVGIGCANPRSPLTVNGQVECLGVQVDDIMSWCDYVFDEKYHLPSLRETQDYIQRFKHLPGIPSTDEVRKNGLNLVNNQVELLKKVEELTLYVIEQNRKIEELEKQNGRIADLERKIEKLSQN